MRRAQLQERDRQLIAVLAEARWLSAEQLRRLFFPGATKRGMRRRLSWLGEGPDALLRRVEWTHNREPDIAWGLTTAGYLVAEEVLETPLEVPRDDVGLEHLAHHVMLTEVLVGLMEARVLTDVARAPAHVSVNNRYVGIFARASHPGYAWNVIGERTMPWRQAEPGGKEAPRRLVPDAILEFPTHRRRVFIESEMGTHTIVAASESKTGATLAKAKAYSSFFSLLASPTTKQTFYAERFPDGYAPEVLFLVRPSRGDARERNVRSALETWRRNAPAGSSFKVATVATALREYLPLIGATPPVAPKVAAQAPGASAPVVPSALNVEEAKSLRAFVYAAYTHFKSARAAERAKGTPEARLTKYPPNEQQVLALVKRLGAGL